MPDYRLALVNGTGPDGPAYEAIMQYSFCQQLGRKLGAARSFYLRGPGHFGQEVLREARAVYQWLRAARDDSPDVRLMLAGYSRGGSAAIMACEMLERDEIGVDSLFLFDAVGRHEFPGGRTVPANVRFSRHARRSLAADFVERYEGTMKRMRVIDGNPIRPLFGNVGLHWRGSGDHQPAKHFLGSHGAIGGVGWRFVVEDSACETAVAAWMTEQLQSRGVEAVLEAFPPRGDAVATHPSALERWLTHNIYQFALQHDEPHLARAAEVSSAVLGPSGSGAPQFDAI